MHITKYTEPMAIFIPINYVTRLVPVVAAVPVLGISLYISRASFAAIACSVSPRSLSLPLTLLLPLALSSPTTMDRALLLLALMLVLAVFLLLSLAALLPPETPAPLFLLLELLSQQHLHCVQQEKMLSTPVPLF